MPFLDCYETSCLCSASSGGACWGCDAGKPTKSVQPRPLERYATCSGTRRAACSPDDSPPDGPAGRNNKMTTNKLERKSLEHVWGKFHTIAPKYVQIWLGEPSSTSARTRPTLAKHWPDVANFGGGHVEHASTMLPVSTRRAVPRRVFRYLHCHTWRAACVFFKNILRTLGVWILKAIGGLFGDIVQGALADARPRNVMHFFAPRTDKDRRRSIMKRARRRRIARGQRKRRRGRYITDRGEVESHEEEKEEGPS